MQLLRRLFMLRINPLRRASKIVLRNHRCIRMSGIKLINKHKLFNYVNSRVSKLSHVSADNNNPASLYNTALIILIHYKYKVHYIIHYNNYYTSTHRVIWKLVAFISKLCLTSNTIQYHSIPWNEIRVIHRRKYNYLRTLVRWSIC